MLLRIVSILFPVFAIVGAGYLYARRQPRDIVMMGNLGALVFVPIALTLAIK